MFKRAIFLIISLCILLTAIPIQADNLYDSKEKSSVTGMRMQPLVDKYHALGETDINTQIAKYKDLQSHYAKSYVAKMSALEVIAGYTNGKFGPNDTLLACQFIRMIVLALGHRPETPAGQPYWQPYVDIALKEGLITAGEIKDYTGPITRELAAVVAFRALMQFTERPAADDLYLDYNMYKMQDYAKISDKYKNDVLLSHRMGVITGNNSIFEPQGTLTRAQGAIIVSRLIDSGLRIEVVPKPDEIITYTRRTEINEANFDFKLKPGEVFKIYPGYFPLPEIYTVFKAMQENLNVAGGYRELQYFGLKDNFYVGQYVSKNDADKFYKIDNSLPTYFAGFGVYLHKCFIKDALKENNSGFLYDINTQDPVNYDKYMKPYAHELLKVLFEDDATEAIRLHDYYLSLALNGKKAEWKSYMLNNRKVHYSAGGATEVSAAGMRIEIYAKGFIDKNNLVPNRGE